MDGFIPPRAFQEFQAASILPIAADMRSVDHSGVHPCAGHHSRVAGGPLRRFLPDARYAAYLRAIGEVGKKAFSSPEDARVYAAIFELSEVKETLGVPAGARDASRGAASKACPRRGLSLHERSEPLVASLLVDGGVRPRRHAARLQAVRRGSVVVALGEPHACQ